MQGVLLRRYATARNELLHELVQLRSRRASQIQRTHLRSTCRTCFDCFQGAGRIHKRFASRKQITVAAPDQAVCQVALALGLVESHTLWRAILHQCRYICAMTMLQNLRCRLHHGRQVKLACKFRLANDCRPQE